MIFQPDDQAEMRLGYGNYPSLAAPAGRCVAGTGRLFQLGRLSLNLVRCANRLFASIAYRHIDVSVFPHAPCPTRHPSTFVTTGDVQWQYENGEICVLLVGTRVSDVPDLLFSIQSRPPEADPVT